MFGIELTPHLIYVHIAQARSKSGLAGLTRVGLKSHFGLNPV